MDKKVSTSPHSWRGKYLLATPAMRDPRFRKTAIYLVNHDESGAMGIIVNKAKTGLSVSGLLETVGVEGDIRVADTAVLSGGPVDIDRGFVLHSPDYFRADSSLKLSETLSLTSTRDVLSALVSEEKAPSRAVIAVGYAGWGPGQLEREIGDNGWLLVDGEEALIFDDDLGAKWKTLLTGAGIPLAALSAMGGNA